MIALYRLIRFRNCRTSLADSSHAQITTQRIPAFFNRSSVVASRSRLPRIFFSQNSAFVLGSVPREQLCPCQKQPWTKIAVLNLGTWMSGFPGRRRSLSRYRTPFDHSILRTASSGAVADVRTLDIAALFAELGGVSDIVLERLFATIYCVGGPR